MNLSRNIKYLLKKELKYNAIGFLLLLMAVWFMIRSCSPDVAPTPHNPVDSLKTAVKNNFVKRDSMIVESVKKDTADKKATRKWNRAKTESLRIIKDQKRDTNNLASHPCDTIVTVLINTCDSALAAKDSSIAEKIRIIKHDSIIFAQQETIIKAQDISIRELQRDVKKQKRLKRIWAAACCLITGAAILK